MKRYFDEFEFDTEQRELRRAGDAVKVEPIVLRLLDVLVRNAGKLVTKQQLIEQVWDGRVVAENAITVAMVRLRKALGHKAGEREYVKNVQRRGYRFVRPVAQQPPEPSSASLAAHNGPPPSFVGRERVLDTLTELLAEVSGGRGQACVIAGEPGIGKTRVLEVLEQRVLARGLCVAWAHCPESGDTPALWPFTHLLQQVLRWSAEHEPDAQLAAWAARVPGLASLLPELAAQGHGDAPVAPLTKHHIFDAIIRVLSRAAEQTTCVFVLDDLHRADAASLELLESWIDQLPRARVLLIATLNGFDASHAVARSHLAYVYGHRNTLRLTLERLSKRDVATYVSALVDDPRGALAQAVFDKSEGNPFFMCEIARQLRDRGLATAQSFDVPDAALALVRRRLAILDEAACGVLSCAAVIGRRFELPTLQAVSGESTSALMASLDEAITRGVIQAAPDSKTSFAFAHELLRVALYETLGPARQRRLHLQVARALEDGRLRGGTVAVGDLAFHFHAALPESDLRKTVQHCGSAAGESAKLFAYADAARYLRRARQAIELMDEPSPRLRMRLLLEHALCARVCGDPEFEALARELIQVAREQHAGSYLGQGALLLDLNPGFPALAGAREALEAALAALPRDDVAMRAAVLVRLAMSAPLAYDADQSSEQIAHATDMAVSSGSTLAQYKARSAQLYMSGGELDQTDANEALSALETLCRQHPLRLTVPPILLGLHQAIRALQAGELSMFDMALDRCDTLCRKLGDRELHWHVERARAVQRVNTGQEQAGVSDLKALHQRAADDALPGTLLFRAYDHCLIAPQVASLTRSELQDALESDAADGPNIWSMKVRALTRAGLHAQALSQLRLIAPAALRKLPRDRDYLGTLGALVHAVLALHAHDYVAPLRDLLADYPQHFAANISFLCEGSVAQLMGLLARSSSQHGVAAQQFGLGAALAERAGLVRAAADSRELLAHR